MQGLFYPTGSGKAPSLRRRPPPGSMPSARATACPIARPGKLIVATNEAEPQGKIRGDRRSRVRSMVVEGLHACSTGADCRAIGSRKLS